MSISILTDFLPIEVEIEGVRYPINWDFRTSILFEQLMLNNNISEKEKSDEALQLYYGYEIDTIKYINNNIQSIITTTDLRNINKKVLLNSKIFKIMNGTIIKEVEKNG